VFLGLLDIFKSKLASISTSPSHAMASPIDISARIHFVLKDWPMNNWMQSPPDFDILHGQVGIEHIGRLPFGAESDPIRYFSKLKFIILTKICCLEVKCSFQSDFSHSL